MLPAPLLAAKIAGTAKIVPIRHPGDAPPQRRYIPSTVLATFIRCRDMTCRFPGCDEPAQVCDIDHTIAYPAGPTQASNLKCLCRKHHLLKTFGGWHDQQLPDGTVGLDLTARADLHHPSGQPTTVPHPVQTHRASHQRRRTEHLRRARTGHAPPQDNARPEPRQAIDDERAHNQTLIETEAAERNRPPPF